MGHAAWRKHQFAAVHVRQNYGQAGRQFVRSKSRLRTGRLAAKLQRMTGDVSAQISEFLATQENAPLGPGRVPACSPRATWPRSSILCFAPRSSGPDASNSSVRWSCSGTTISMLRTPFRRGSKVPTEVSFMPSCTGASRIIRTRNTGGGAWGSTRASRKSRGRSLTC